MLSRKSKDAIVENVVIEKMAAEGKCIARVDGRVVFVEYVAPGDIVDLRMKKVRSKFAEAEAVNFKEKSPLREEAFCSHFGTCGGCKWQHISYSEQLNYKSQQVHDALERIAKIEFPAIKPILACKQDREYRNKLDFTFSDKRWLTLDEIRSGQEFQSNALGFHIRHAFDKVLQIDTCHLMPEPSNAIRQAVYGFALKNEYPFYNLKNQDSGYLRNLILRQSSNGQIMVILQVAQDMPEMLEPIMDFIKNSFPQVTSLNYIINQKLNESYYDLDVVCYNGTPFIEEEMEGLTFRVGPKSFYQTNSLQAYELYKVARDFAQLKGDEIVYDLYTGTGTIANFVAKKAKKVVGIESVPEAIEDAKLNSEINKIDNTVFYTGDMKDMLNEDFILEHGKPDVIITDPPRAGMHADVVDVLIKSQTSRIVYVSCNPATQARDLAMLDATYKVVAVQPVDMFPQTAHVENVVLLEKR
jgi:23S rRNA (uracil1939-C5)-methyltransferase